MGRTKVKLRICDIDCTVTSDDSEEYIRAISDKIDRSITDVLKKNDRISLSMAAIITAITYCDESIKAKAKLAEFASAEKDMTGAYSRLKQEADSAQAQAERLRSEVQTLQTLLAQNQNTGNAAACEPIPGMVLRCINGKTTYVPKTLTENPEIELFDIPAVEPTCVEDARTLEELYRSIDTNEREPARDDSPEHMAKHEPHQQPSQPDLPSKSKVAEKHGKQSRHKKKQQKKAQKEHRKLETPDTLHASPTQRAEPPASEVLIGNFTRPKSPLEPEPLSDDAFISCFKEH